MKPTVKLALIDDHALFRQGLAFLLQQEANFQVIASASGGLEGMAQIAEHAPDVVLLDVDMPHMNGLETLNLLHKQQPDLKVMMLTVAEHPEMLNRCLAEGARGYVIKNAEAEFLIAAIYRILDGEIVVSPQMEVQIAAAAQGDVQNKLQQLASLSPRELDVLRFIAQGVSNKAIAHHLSLSENTVKVHVQNILKKLHLNSRTQAAVFANAHFVV